MIDPKVLKYFGTSNEQLRTFFTAPAPSDPDGSEAEQSTYGRRKKFMEWVSGLIEDGRTHCYKNYRHYAAVDLMKDAPPIARENVPLMAYAQGRIDVTACKKELSTLSCAEKFIENPKPGTSESSRDVKPVVNLPRLVEVCVNLPRQMIKRRVDAQSNKYNSLRPFFKYECRSTTLVAHLRGEVMSQYCEVMSDAFGYRHQHRQSIHDMLHYGHTLQFPAGGWETETQTAFAPENFDGTPVEATDVPEGEKAPKLRTVIAREGVRMVNVHPARTFYDTAHPRATLNTDTGCRFVGFWDVWRFGAISDNPSFFNTDKVAWNTSGHSVLDQNRAFFDLVFADSPINFPQKAATQEGLDPAAANERTANRHVYAQTDGERSVFLTDIRVRVTPKEHGMGKYAHPVWLRLLVANDETVIYAEWLPSLPAVVWAHNDDDLRLLTLGEAHLLMPWQDQLSNIFSQLLMKMKHSLLRVILINTDVVPRAVVDKLRSDLDSPKYYVAPHLLEVSFKEVGEGLGLDLDKVFRVSAASTTARDDAEFINNAFKAIIQILAIMERMMNLSPQEQGQPMPREATAEEIAALEHSTQVTYNAIGASCDEARGAWKRIIYESSMAFGSDRLYLPVSQRFSKDTIRKAGFEIETEETEEGADSAAQPGRTIIGTKQRLVHDYVWNTRDGGDRYTNRESANILVSLLGQVLPLIGPEALGKKRIFEVVNEIFRLLASYDLKLDLEEGEENNVMSPEMQAKLQEFQAALQEQQAETGGLVEAVTKLNEVVQELTQQVMVPAQGGAPAGA